MSFTRKVTVLSLLLCPVYALAANSAQAESASSEIETLRAQVELLTARLDAMEKKAQVPEVDMQASAGTRHTVAPAAETGAVSPAWYDRIKLKGDFRFRHETIDIEDSNDRHRQRIRARPVLTADILHNVEIGFGMATGGDDPVSTNQTLGNANSSKDVRLDLAYFSWDTPLEGLNVTAGKFKNPLHRAGGNGLIWDSDLRPEGGSARFRKDGWFGNAMWLWAEESSQDDDNILFAGQAGWRGDLGATNLLLGAGYYNLTEIEGEDVLFDGDPRGNTLAPDGTYLYGYEEVEAFAELRFDLLGKPTTLFADFVHNLEAGDFDTGYALGGIVKFPSDRHPWQLGYTWQDLEADAVFAIFTDSDFIGGGTDGKGHILQGKYALTRQISLGSTLFINERGGNAGEAEDFNRLMLDIAFKY